MAAPAYLLSLLGRQRALLGPEFFKRYNSDWLVWEPGAWRPARSMASSNTETTQQPSSNATPTRPEGEDALCFELKRLPGARLVVGRATENDVVINDLTVSREHFTLQFGGKQWTALAKDTPDKPLQNGAVMTAGDVKLTFYTAEGFPVRLESEAKRKR